MPVAQELRSLEIDVPAQPDSLVKLSLLMAEEELNLAQISALIETDMALAAAVLKAVNSSLYGLKGRVQTVHQAITYLGMREVAGITYEMGLRAAFPPSPLLEPIWQRAARRGMLMGRLAQALDMDAWAAHSAGLFEECGKAVLFRHASDTYAALLKACRSDLQLTELELADFGVSHDALGAALCESWGLAASAVVCVRQHVVAQTDTRLPVGLQRRGVLALSIIVHTLMSRPQALDDTVQLVAAQAGLDLTLALRAARRLLEMDEQAQAHAR
jgi:HD-like signal output (HDOD) protein